MRRAVAAGVSALAIMVAAAPAASAVAGPSPAPTPSATVSPSPSPSASATPTTPPKFTATFAYGQHRHQRMDVWWREDGVRRPTVFLIHGGWWAGGDKRYMKAISAAYYGLGYAVVTINYRLSNEAPWPAQRTDALDAIATVRRHADQFGIDPDRYVLVGFSAGGHIAASVGTYGDGLPGLRGVVGVSPVVSPLTAYADGDWGADKAQRRLRKAAIALAGGCGPTTCPRTWSSMEVPLHASAGDAPMLTVHSLEEFVPPYQSELLKDALADHGVPMSIRVQPGTAHSSPLYRDPGVTDAVRAWIAGRLSF